MSCSNWTCTKRYKVVPLLFINHPSCLPIFRSRLIWEQGLGGTKFFQRDDQILGGPSPEIMTMIFLPTFCWRLQRYPSKKTFLVQSKVTEDSGNFFWGQKLGGFLWKKRTRLLYPATVELQKKCGDIFTWRHRSDPESTSFCRAFYHDPKIFISFFPFAFLFFASGHVFWPLFKNGTYGKQGLTTSTWDGFEMGVCLRSKECWRKMAPDKTTMIQYITCQVWLGARSLTKNLREESLVNREYLFPKGRKSLFTK